MHLEKLDKPTAPVNLDEVKKHLRIDGDEEDSLLESFIEAAWEQAEQMTGRAFGARDYKLTVYDPESKDIELPYPPLISVDSVKVDGESVSDYGIEYGYPARIRLSDTPDAEVVIEYSAGDPLPERGKIAIMELVAAWEQYRSPVTSERAREVPQTVERLLRGLRVW